MRGRERASERRDHANEMLMRCDSLARQPRAAASRGSLARSVRNQSGRAIAPLLSENPRNQAACTRSPDKASLPGLDTASSYTYKYLCLARAGKGRRVREPKSHAERKAATTSWSPRYACPCPRPQQISAAIWPDCDEACTNLRGYSYFLARAFACKSRKTRANSGAQTEPARFCLIPPSIPKHTTCTVQQT